MPMFVVNAQQLFNSANSVQDGVSPFEGVDAKSSILVLDAGGIDGVLAGSAGVNHGPVDDVIAGSPRDLLGVLADQAIALIVAVVDEEVLVLIGGDPEAAGRVISAVVYPPEACPLLW